MLSALFFSGCQKVTEDMMPVNDLQDQQVSKTNKNDNKCQLHSLVWSDGSFSNFHYNQKGLADKWYIQWAPGSYNDQQMTYDNKNRLKNYHIFYEGGGAINYTVYYTGNLATRATGYFDSNGALGADNVYTYNRKGQMVREDDDVNDDHTIFYYNRDGFNTGSDFYVGTELIYQVFYKYNIPNKDPMLAINGVDFGFPYVNWPLFDKRWWSQSSAILYDEGIPYVVYDTDPAQTTMQTGPHNYMTYLAFYNRATEAQENLTCTYQNCGEDTDDYNNTTLTSSAGKTGQLSIKNRINKILNRPSKNIKQELKELVKQMHK